jgi:hypothetical protein
LVHSTVVIVLTIVHVTILFILGWLIASHKVRVNLLIWVDSILTVILFVPILIWVHVTIHSTHIHVMTFHVNWCLVWNLSLLRLLLGLWLVFIWLLVVTFSVHTSIFRI